MAAVPSANVPAVFDLRSASLTLVSLVLKTADLDELSREMQQRFGDTPNLFDNDPVVIDLAALGEAQDGIDFGALVSLLERHKLRPIAVKAASPAALEAAAAAGLVEAPLDGPAPVARSAEPAAEAESSQISGEGAAAHTLPEAAPQGDAPEGTAAEVVAARPGPGATLIVDKPLRSGQQVYARGGDLVVLGVVNFGAEVIADGSIHVYAPLRGRAIAGARGDTHARIFSTCMEPQLVSIAGTYRTTDTALPDDVRGKAAQIRLHGERLLVEPLKP
jgi:septum site-determining protein MinC